MNGTPSITPFLMFEGQAEEALTRYAELFGANDLSLVLFGPDGAGAEGTLERGAVTLKGQRLMAMDSSVAHGFGFTPALSLFVTCEDEAEIDRLFAGLSEEGAVHMPLASYPFAEKFAWVDDRYGVSWQLFLA